MGNAENMSDLRNSETRLIGFPSKSNWIPVPTSVDHGVGFGVYAQKFVEMKRWAILFCKKRIGRTKIFNIIMNEQMPLLERIPYDAPCPFEQLGNQVSAKALNKIGIGLLS
jgi:hypothetical protein